MIYLYCKLERMISMAKFRNVRCQHCEITDTSRDDMVFEMVGDTKPVRKNYHKHCWESHLKHREFLAHEMTLKDELNETLKEIYGVKEIPSQAWALLEKLRGGNPVFGAKQVIGKRYREGYEYPLIKETFEYCSDTIEYWNGVKNFDGFMGAFKYALSIVIDKVYTVEQRVKTREKQELLITKHLEVVEDNDSEFVESYKKKEKPKTDITDFLD